MLVVLMTQFVVDSVALLLTAVLFSGSKLNLPTHPYLRVAEWLRIEGNVPVRHFRFSDDPFRQ